MAQDDGAGWRREGSYLFELIGITAVAVAQPVLDVIQQAPEELVNRQAGAAEIVVFALLLVLGPAVVFWLLEQPFRLVSAGARRWVHVGFLGFWVGVFVVEVVKSALGADPHRWLWLVGLAAAVGATVLFWRSTIARTVLAYLALAAPVFLGLFLFVSPVADLVLTGTVDPADVAIEDPAPVVLIAFDELPVMSLLDGDGHIDADAFPAFADLADESNWYRNNTGVSPVTPSALPAILTGQLPSEAFPAPVATNFNESIFTLLGGTYDVDAVETLTRVCPTTICEAEAEPSSASTLGSLFTLSRTVFEGVARPTTAAADFEFVLEHNPADPEAPHRFQTFIDDVAAGEGATLDVGHFLLPHQPWDFLASGRTYEAPDPPRSAEYGDWYNEITAQAGRQRHLAQLQYTDALLGDALEELRASGRYEDALVIVTADHGAAFVGGDSLRGLTEDNYPQIMWAPLFVKLPGQTEGEVSDRATESIDVVPTIADVLDIEIPWEVDGTSVFEDTPDDRPARMYDWRFNDVDPDADGFAVLDRQEGFAQVVEGSTPMAGDPDDPDALLRLGPYGDLVGAEVADAAGGAAVDFAVTTYSRPTFTVAEGTTDLPAYVEGIWAEEPDPWIAVAIDGTVAGIGKTYRQGEFATFWALLAERLFIPGEHDLTFHAVSGPTAAPALSPPIEMVPRQD